MLIVLLAAAFAIACIAAAVAIWSGLAMHADQTSQDAEDPAEYR